MLVGRELERRAAALLRQAAGCSKVSDCGKGDVRVQTAFNRMLRVPGAAVRDVEFGGEGVIVTVGLRRRRKLCAGCGTSRGLQIKDRRVKRWRHLDLGACRCVIECELRRVDCRRCGALALEAVPWARARAPYTRDFEDVVSWLAQQMAKTPITGLLRIGWDSVGKIVQRVVSDHLDEGRLDGLVMLGVDEISYQADHRFLTCVADHETGGIVWAAPGRNAATLQGFFDGLTDEQKGSIRAVSIDMSAGYEKAIRAETGVPQARVCFDPFHVVALGGKAVDQVRRAEYNRHGRSASEQGTWIKGTRYSLLKDPANQTVGQARQAPRRPTHQPPPLPWLSAPRRAALALPHPPRGRLRAPRRLARMGLRSKLKPFVGLARTIRKHKAGVLAAIDLGLSNGRLEGLNSKIRLLSHRAYGFHSANALIATIYLCCAGIQISLPGR